MRKARQRNNLLLPLIVTALLLITRVDAKAQSSTSAGVDLIILIDQSASMRGTQQHQATDPGEVRVSTAQYLMEYLHFDGAYVNQRMNRVTVIGFGSPDQTHSIVDLTPLETAQDVEKAQAGIVAEDLSNTSFIAALRLVREQFPPETDSESRQRIIVIITDGGPYDERATRTTNPFTYGDYFAEVRSYYDAELGVERFPLYVIGIDKANLYWPNVVRHWESIAGVGHAIRVQQIEESNREIVRLLCPLLNPDQPPEYCALADLGPHFVQPYARTVQFSFFKYDPMAQARLYRPGDYPGAYIKPSDPDVEFEATETDGNLRDEIYRISNPAVGCWLTDREGTGQVDVFVQVVFHLMRITSPTSAHPQMLPLDIELELLDEQGRPVDELPDYPVALDTNLIGENGNERPIQMQPVGGGQYRTISPLMLAEAGFYTLTMDGKTTVAPSPLVGCITSTLNIPIFQRQIFQLFVSEPRLMVISPESPHLRYGPITDLVFGFVDPDGHTIFVPQDVPWTMRISAQSPSGEQVDLPAPQWENGRFRILEPFFLAESGVYKLIADLEDKTGAQLFEYQTTFTTTENIHVLTPGVNHPAFAPVGEVRIELCDDNDQPIVEDPNYPIKLLAEIKRPDGTQEQVELLSTNEPGLYYYPVNWVFDTASLHTLDILGYTKLLPGDPDQLAFVARRQVDVSANLPYFCVTSPNESQSEAVYSLHRWFLPPFPFALRSMPIRVELRHGTQLAQAAEFFVTDPDQLFALEMNGPGGQSLAVPLTDVSGAGQVFGVDLAELTEPGTYTATVSLAGTVRGNVPTEGAWPDRTVVFGLHDPTAYFVIWWSGMGAAAIAILAVATWQVLNRLILPPVRGKLVMERVPSGAEIDSKSLTPLHRNRLTLKGKQLGNILQLKDIRIKRIAPEEKTEAGRKIPIEGIEVMAHTGKGDEITGTLYAERVRGKSNTLRKPTLKTSDDETYQFRYEN